MDTGFARKRFGWLVLSRPLIFSVYRLKMTISSRESGAVADCTLRRTGDFFVGCGPLFGPHRLVTLVIRWLAGMDTGFARNASAAVAYHSRADFDHSRTFSGL
jgi:hypothetical protein